MRKKGISCRFLDVRLFEKLVRNMMCLIVNGLKMSDKSLTSRLRLGSLDRQ